jgi:HEAT repeat protein
VSDLLELLDSLVGDNEWARHEALERLRTVGASVRELEALAGHLAGDDPGRRAGARMALGALATPGGPVADQARDRLDRAIASGDADLRILAATAMGESTNTAFLPRLIHAVDDGDPNVVAAAADALGDLGHPAALDPLAALTDHAELWMRAAAVVALGRLRDPAALPSLHRAAAITGLEGTVVDAVRAIGDPAGLDVLADLCRALPGPALEAAGSILSAHSDLTPPEWVVEGAREHASSLLAKMEDHDDPAVGRLLGIAATPETIDALVRLAGPHRRSDAAINGLLAVPAERRADPILDRIGETEAEDTVPLLSILPPLDGPDRIQRLVPLLSHPDPRVRAAAAEALARAPAERSLPLLADALIRDPVAPEVVRAAGALGPAACVVLLPLLADPHPDVRAAAADGLGRCASPSLAGDIQAALAREEDAGARRSLLRSLGRVAGGSAVPTLAPSLDDPDAETRLAAIEGLGATGSPDAVAHLRDALDRTPAETLAAIRALGELEHPSAAAVIEPRLRSDDLEQRRTAVRAIRSRAGSLDRSTLEGLADDPDGWIRVWAARLLGDTGAGGRAVLERLIAEDRDPDVRTEARRALARLAP